MGDCFELCFLFFFFIAIILLALRRKRRMPVNFRPGTCPKVTIYLSSHAPSHKGNLNSIKSLNVMFTRDIPPGPHQLVGHKQKCLTNIVSVFYSFYLTKEFQIWKVKQNCTHNVIC